MRLLRRCATVLLSAALACAGLTTAAAASAAGRDGYCQGAAGTTVVVDFQQLGGGVVIRCATPLPNGATGLDALRAAGVTYQGVLRYGDAFLCRLYGRPAATTALPVSGSAGYHEQCIDTPPTAAYWSYWSASNGGRWTYSSYGVRNRAAIAGGFEGWSFSLNASASGAPPPRVAPTRPAAASPASSPRSTRPPAATASQTPGAGRSTSRVGASATPLSTSAPARTTPRTTPGAPASRTRSSSGSVRTSGSSTPTTARSTSGGPSRSTSRGASSGPTSGSSTGSSSTSGLVVSAGSLAPPTRPAPTSPATAVGAGLLAFLVAAGAGTAWRRRRVQ